MKITIKELTLNGFKGIENSSYNLGEGENFFHGKNGSGKTTLFDSFLWLFFGKDHQGRSDHQLKTIKNGETQPKAQCSVRAVLSVDNKELSLTRIYAEDWVKPKGQAEEVFKGNTTFYYINDVNVKKSDYDAKISELCSEQVFRPITSPSYFPNLNWKEQRTLLFQMVGDISDDSIAADNQDFKQLLIDLTGVSFDSFKKEIQARKRRLKSQIDDIDPKIDGIKSVIPAALNWSTLANEINTKEDEIKSVENQLSDIVTRSEEENKRISSIREQINELTRANQELKFEEQREIDSKLDELKSKARALHVKVGDSTRDYNSKKARLDFLLDEKKRREAELTELRSEWASINAEKATFDNKEFICPTCKRSLEVADIESKQSEMTENFNSEKAAKLERNKSKGKPIADRVKEIQAEIDSLGELQEVDTTSLDNEIKEVNEEIAKQAVKISVNYTSLPVFRENTQKIEELVLSCNPQSVDTSDLKARKDTLRNEVNELRSKLAQRDIIENSTKTVSDLESNKKVLNQELADLEKKEFTIKEFEYKKNAEYETRINQMFRIIKFKLFKELVNGEIEPTCECIDENGVPYSVLNNAAQVASGLDIINTLSRFYGIYAPIWIDNRESVTNIPLMDAQIINLVVDPKEPQLIQK